MKEEKIKSLEKLLNEVIANLDGQKIIIIEAKRLLEEIKGNER